MKKLLYTTLLSIAGIITVGAQIMYKSESYWIEYDEAATEEVIQSDIVEELTYIFFGTESVKLSGKFDGEYLVTGVTDLEDGETAMEDVKYSTKASKLSTTDVSNGDRISIVKTRYAHPTDSNGIMYTIIFTLPENYRYCFVAES